MPSYDYLEMKKRNPDWVWPRSDTHAVLGVPGSLECYKTWVEPGNSFSPGISSFGVSVWIWDKNKKEWYIPERMKLDKLKWSFKDGKLPILISEWSAGDVDVMSRLFKRKEEGVEAYTDTMRLLLSAGNASNLAVYLVVHSYGACGGFIEEIEQTDQNEVLINGFPLIISNNGFQGFGAAACSDGRDDDICRYLLENKIPKDRKVHDQSGWCSCAFLYDICLDENETRELSWHFPNYLPKSSASQLIAYTKPQITDPGLAEKSVEEFWMEYLDRFKLEVPDKKFHDAFYGTLLHMLMMFTGDDVRIETSFYPLFWLRDGVYIINALEKAGFSDLAERSLKRLLSMDFAGGFGSEADALAEGIWALAEHYMFTNDMEWLGNSWPAIKRKADFIEKMMFTTEDIFDYSTEMVTNFIRASMVCGLVCHPSKAGLIQGVMDHHIPIYWINNWAVMGLLLASKCAQALGKEDDSDNYARLAESLKKSLYEYYPKDFLETPELQGIYSFGSALWPTHAFPPEMVKDKFDEWWETWRFKGGRYHVALDWTYFEAAQAHNYLFLGENEKFQIMLNRYYDYQDVPGLYGYNEGKGCFYRGIPTYGGQDWGFGNILPYRGWDLFDCNLPHNWVSSELFLMMRDALLYEEDGTLVVGAGIPLKWLEAGNNIKIEDAPTHFGKVTVKIQCGSNTLDITVRSEKKIPEILIHLIPLGARKSIKSSELENSIHLEKGRDY